MFGLEKKLGSADHTIPWAALWTFVISALALLEIGTRASREAGRSRCPWICKLCSRSPRDSRRTPEAAMGVSRRLRGRALKLCPDPGHISHHLQCYRPDLGHLISALNQSLCFHPHCHLAYFQCNSYSEPVKTEVTLGNSSAQNPAVVPHFTQRKSQIPGQTLQGLAQSSPLYVSNLFSCSSAHHSLPSCHPGIFVAAPLCRCASMQGLCSGRSLSWMLFSQTPAWWFPRSLLKSLFKPHFLYENFPDYLLYCSFPHISWALWIPLPLVYFSVSCYIYHLLTYHTYLLYVDLLCLLSKQFTPLVKK